jgi:Ca-activated chloride channel family protein
MNPKLLPILPEEATNTHTDDAADRGFGALSTPRGCLPLVAMDVRAHVSGLTAQVVVEQTFVNTAKEPIEATYLFPLPDRAAVTSFRLRIEDRLIEGVLKERAAAREEYDQAIEQGHRAAIAEENRPDVFSMRIGNLMPGDRAVVTLKLAGPLEYADGEATFRFPLVVAPRYIPGLPLPGESVGPGTVADTDQTPDASLITPPVLLPGFPNPVRLSLTATIDPAGLSIAQIASSLHAVETAESDSGRRVVRLQPGERLNRDFILRFAVAEAAIKTSLVLTPDTEGDAGTFQLTLVPPAAATASQQPRDVVLLLDRSGSMSGWKIVAARRAAARIVDSLTPADCFGVLAFDSTVESPQLDGRDDLLPATDRNRFRAVEFLARLDARGGTELAAPLKRATKMLAAADPSRERILVLVTDGQVGNEDHILRTIGKQARELKIFTLGIDMATNAGFLRRLAAVGGGACDLVESEDRLDDVMEKIHRRISAPLLTGVQLAAAGGLTLDQASLTPERMPDLHAGVPLVVHGRYQGQGKAAISLSARDSLGSPWLAYIAPATSENPAIPVLWARGRIRDLEDRYACSQGSDEKLERQIVETSLRFGVLSRFTAFVAVDRSAVVNQGGPVRTIVQPVEMPEGWQAPALGGAEMQACLAAPVSALSLSCRAGGAASSGGRLQSRGAKFSRKKSSGNFGFADPQTEEDVTPPDLSAYRSRAAKWVKQLGRDGGGDVAARSQALRDLARNLAELVADLKSVGAPASEIEPLAKLQADLARLTPDADAGQIDALRESAGQTLCAFAGVRQAFWKKPTAKT